VGKFIQHNIIRFASIFEICNEQLFCGWHAGTERVESVLEWLLWQYLSEHRPVLLYVLLLLWRRWIQLGISTERVNETCAKSRIYVAMMYCI